MSTAEHEPSTCPVCSGKLEKDGVCLMCLLQEGLEAERVTGTGEAAGKAAPERALTLPCEFAGYRLVREIASGGMGIVYEAEDLKLKRLVAMKVVRNAHFATREEAARFKAETQAVAQLDHPDIVPIYESGEEEGVPYFTMRLAEGGSLAERLKRRGEMREREAATFMVRIAKAVQYAHEHGVLHRDLKPANILLDVSGRPMLSDFGLAKLLDAEFQLTKSHAYVGTPHYMSPEQAAGKAKEVTTASDVWALGVMLFQMLTAKLPFTGGSAVEVMRRITQEEPEISSSGKLTVSKGEVKAGKEKVSAASLGRVHADLATLILRCLEKRPERRLRSAGFLADELEKFLNGEPIESRAVGAVERLWKLARRNKAVTLAAAGASFSLIAGSGVALWQMVKAMEAKKVAVKQKQEAQTVSLIVLDTISDLDERQSGSDIDPDQMKQQMMKRIMEFNGDPVLKAGLLSKTAAMFKNEQCLENYREALALLEGVLDKDDPKVWDMRFLVAGQRAVIEDSSDECMAELRRVLDWQREHLGRWHRQTLYTQFTLGKNLNIRNRPGEAEDAKELMDEVCEKAEGSEVLAVRDRILVRLEHLTAVFQAGQEVRAIEMGCDYVRKATEEVGEKDLLTARTMARLAECQRKAGRLDEAVTEGWRAVNTFWESVGPDNFYAKGWLTEFSMFLGKKGDKEGRLELVRDAVRVCDLKLGPRHPFSLYRVESCEFVQNEMGLYKESVELGVQWLGRVRTTQGSLPEAATGVLRELAWAWLMQRNYASAETSYRELTAMMKEHKPEDLQMHADMSNLAWTLVKQNKAAEALPMLEQAIQAFEERGQSKPVLARNALPKARKRLEQAQKALAEGKTAGG